MIELALSGGMGSVRWAISPIHETVSVARLLTEPSRHPGYREWLRRRARALGTLNLTPLTRFMADQAYRPDFLDPPPAHPRSTIEEGLAALAATPDEVVRAELADAASGWPAEARQRLLDDWQTARTEASLAIEALWTRSVAADWPAMQSALQAEVTQRAFDVSERGLADVVGSLHPSLRLAGDRLVVDTRAEVVFDASRGSSWCPHCSCPTACSARRPITGEPRSITPARGATSGPSPATSTPSGACWAGREPAAWPPW